MKKFLYTIIACIIIPFATLGMFIYSICYVLELLFKSINILLTNAMYWIDRNITENIRG